MKRWDAGQRQVLAEDRCREVPRLLRAQVVVAVQLMPSALPQAQVQMLRLT